MERSEAKNQGLTTYNTGRPCRNGHITYRYTLSGSCSLCVNPAKQGDTASFDKKNLISAKFRLYDIDVDSFALVVWGFAVIHYPSVTQKDVTQKLQPTDRTAGTGMYSFNCRPEDVAALRDIAADFGNRHKIDLPNIVAYAQNHLPPDTTPSMNFK